MKGPAGQQRLVVGWRLFSMQGNIAAPGMQGFALLLQGMGT